jgi:hypothetical protein
MYHKLYDTDVIVVARSATVVRLGAWHLDRGHLWPPALSPFFILGIFVRIAESNHLHRPRNSMVKRRDIFETLQWPNEWHFLCKKCTKLCHHL